VGKEEEEKHEERGSRLEERRDKGEGRQRK